MRSLLQQAQHLADSLRIPLRSYGGNCELLAIQALSLQGNVALVGTGATLPTGVGVCVRADGGLNLGQTMGVDTVGNNSYVGYQAG